MVSLNYFVSASFLSIQCRRVAKAIAGREETMGGGGGVAGASSVYLDCWELPNTAINYVMRQQATLG